MKQILDFVLEYFALISMLIAIITAGFWLKLDSKYAKKVDVNTLSHELTNSASRISLLETKVDNLPTAKDFAELQILMTDIKGETKATNSQVLAISHQVALLLESKLQKD